MTKTTSATTKSKCKIPPKVFEVTKPINHKTNKRMMIVSNINSPPLIKNVLLSTVNFYGFNYCASEDNSFVNGKLINRSCNVSRNETNGRY